MPLTPKLTMSSLNRLADARILVVGDVMLDRYWWGKVDRISPEAPVPVVLLDRSTAAAGGAANVAINIAGLGATPTLIGAVGNDADGSLLAAELSLRNVDPAYLLKLNGRPTSVKTRVIAHSQQVVRIDSETVLPLSPEDEEAARTRLMQGLATVDGVVISDYAKGFLTVSLLRDLIDECRRRGKKVFVDPKGKDYAKYAGATLLTPNRREAAEACKFEESMPDVVVRSGEKLLRDLSIDRVLITEGEHGMTLFEPGSEPVHIDTAAQQIYDVTGAGDTVIAVLAAAVFTGSDFVQASHLANVAAGLVVEQVGTTAISLDHLTKTLSETE